MTVADTSTPQRPDILVVGAGPAGLTLALQARAHGATVRVVERRTERWRPSRAMVVFPRTLELLRPLGATETLLGLGDRSGRVHLHSGDGVRHLEMPELSGTDTAYPFLLVIRQAVVEEVLSGQLAVMGVSVERGVELTGCHDTGVSVRADLRVGDGRVERAEASYVVGCDGMASTVRHQAGIAFRGFRYRHSVVLADVEACLEPGVVHAWPGRKGIVVLFPAGETANWRLLATRRPRAGPAAPDALNPDRRSVQELLDRASGGRVALRAVRWTSEVDLQHRLATRFHKGHLLLAGDAAHVHSPAGAQGLNSAVADGCNLGWKLALVTSGISTDALLDSYGVERRSAARRRLSLTSAVFFAESTDNWISGPLRSTLAPRLAPLVLGSRPLVRYGVEILGQLRLRYPNSPLNSDATAGTRGVARRLRPGDRLPDGDVWASGHRTRLHGLLNERGFTLLLFGAAEGWDQHRVEELRTRYGVFMRSALVDRSMRMTDGRLDVSLSGAPGDLVLVRPDGYIAVHAQGHSLATVEEFFRRWLPGAPLPDPYAS